MPPEGKTVAADGLVELSDAIELVRQQLVSAQARGRQVAAGQALTFAVGKVSLDLSGEVTTSVGGSGGVKFWVVTADAKAERARAAAHRVVVELVPQTIEGGSFIVSDELDAPPSS
jgi:hypothetical protein